jgi:hypothetical protein
MADPVKGISDWVPLFPFPSSPSFLQGILRLREGQLMYQGHTAHKEPLGACCAVGHCGLKPFSGSASVSRFSGCRWGLALTVHEQPQEKTLYVILQWL